MSVHLDFNLTQLKEKSYFLAADNEALCSEALEVTPADDGAAGGLWFVSVSASTW